MSNKKTRCNGEGTIYRLKDGKWRGEFNWVDENGKMQRKSWKSKNKIDVKRKLDEFKLNVHIQTEKINISAITIEEYAKYWLESVYKTQVKPLSYRRKESSLKNQVIPIIGNCKCFRCAFLKFRIWLIF